MNPLSEPGRSLGADTIPINVINTIAGAVDTIQLFLAHLGKGNAGY